MAREYKQGKYELKNPEKYRGDPAKLVFRSSYELKVMEWCDKTPAVLEWSAENIVVPYYDTGRQKKRRYIVDVWMKYVHKSGETITTLLEIKPHNKCQPPKKTRNKRAYEEALLEYITNQCKWKAAEEYARERGWNFEVITENTIFK